MSQENRKVKKKVFFMSPSFPPFKQRKRKLKSVLETEWYFCEKEDEVKTEENMIETFYL